MKEKRLTGASAYKYIALLGMYCQQSRSPDVTIEEPLDLELLIGADDNGQKILADLIKCKLVEKVGEDVYSCTFFIDQNKQLLSNWNNGAMKAKKAKKVSAIENLSKSALDDVDQHFVDFYQSDDWKQRKEIIDLDYKENVEWRETYEG